MSGRGLIIAAPSSGSGKTTVTLGLLRALSNRGVGVRSAKSGPDYIDTRFHAAASRGACVNLDAWAMGADRLTSLAAGDGLLLVEGAMGLFDGAPPDGKGATADLARTLGLPVLLVVDAARMGHSIGPLVAGFAAADPAVRIAGVICNQTGSDRHEAMLANALFPLNLPVLGMIRRDGALSHPSRHLGLVQAEERPDLDAFLDHAAGVITASVDVDAVQSLATPLPPAPPAHRMPPPAQRIAVARDQAFAFAYPHLLADWRDAGAEITVFSPLADQAPPPCDLVILPGGYPELHAGQLAANTTFMDGLRKAAQTGAVYGECGGYMVLGRALTDKDGQRHQMAGLLDLETSFAKRRLHLGYRRAVARGGPFPGTYGAHEFHYATTLHAKGDALFHASDATGADLPPAGLINGTVAGSFLHIIDRIT